MGILYAFESIRVPFLTALFSVVTYFGSELAFIVAAIVVYWCVNKKHGYFLLATGMLGTVVNQFLKFMCQVPRPWVRDPDFTIVESARADATGYSFPSGHAGNVSAIFGGIARFTKKTAIRVVCIVIIALVAISRLYLGVHYLSDVLVGLAIGLVLVFALYPLIEKSDEKPQILLIVFGTIAVLALAAGLFFEFHAWPADIDPDNMAEAVKTEYMMFGCALALVIAIPIERKKIRFETAAPWWAQVLKVVLGLACVMALRAGLKPVLSAVFGTLGIAHGIRYGIMVLFVALVWPLTFPWFQKGCPLSRGMKKALKIIGIILLVLIILLGVLYWVVTRDTKAAPIETDTSDNPLITPLGVTMLSGHRAGGGIAPESTLMALENCVENDAFDINVFEFDLHLTADGVLVLLHDGTLDRTSDAVEVFGETDVEAGEKTYEELRQLNMGAQFVAADGTMPFADLHGDEVPDELRILSLDDALAYIEAHGNYGYIIEIKNSGELGYEAADLLYATLVKYDILDRAVIGTFHNEVTAYMDEMYPDMLRSAGVNEVLDFYYCMMLNRNVPADHFRFQALQIPTTDYVINLGTSRLVNYAHRYNIAVQYWTIDDPEEMARLQSIGADAVMTNYPDIGAQVFNQP